MQQFNKAISDIDSMNSELKTVESKIEQKLNIISTYNTYISGEISDLKTKKLGETNKTSVIFGYNQDKNKIVGGNFGLYGNTIYPAFVKIPSDVFNYNSATGSVYKKSGIVEFYDRDSTTQELSNKDTKIVYADILKDDAVKNADKTDVFKTFNTNRITLAVQVASGLASINRSEFNMIEINPYLPGSFDIEEIRIYTVDQYYKNDMLVPDKTIEDLYEDVGTSRIMVGDTYNMYRVEFDIKLKFQNNGFPFGLKSLHFYKADMDAENDTVIVEIDKNDYIASVGQDITIIKPDGEENTTTDRYGVKYYMFYDNGVLQTPLSNPISRNITKFYAEIPLRESLTGIIFNSIKLR